MRLLSNRSSIPHLVYLHCTENEAKYAVLWFPRKTTGWVLSPTTNPDDMESDEFVEQISHVYIPFGNSDSVSDPATIRSAQERALTSKSVRPGVKVPDGLKFVI